MVVWDRLLEYRIQLQKILQNINKFPQHNSWPFFVENIQDGNDSTHNRDVDKHGDNDTDDGADNGDPKLCSFKVKS